VTALLEYLSFAANNGRKEGGHPLCSPLDLPLPYPYKKDYEAMKYI